LRNFNYKSPIPKPSQGWRTSSRVSVVKIRPVETASIYETAIIVTSSHKQNSLTIFLTLLSF
jgi:hypothetical protein